MAKKRFGKTIKFTDDEYQRLRRMIGDSSSFNTLKEYVESSIRHFTSEEKENVNTQFLVPSRAGTIRSIWIDGHCDLLVREFAREKDVSNNAVVFTAIKRNLDRNQQQ